MIRIFPYFQASTPKLVVGLCLLGILFSSMVVAPPLQARAIHELGPTRGGGIPGVSPDLGGDDDQPTLQPTPGRRMIASVTEVGSQGSGGRSLEPRLSTLFTQVKTVLKKRTRGFWAMLSPGR